MFKIGPLRFRARQDNYNICLLYTSDAADERSSVDLGGRRIIKKKEQKKKTTVKPHRHELSPRLRATAPAELMDEP